MDTADILWDSGIFLAILDEPELVTALMDKITHMMIEIMNHYRKFAVDHLDPFANTQHGYMIPGRLMIRNDSSIMVSPDTYRQVISPQDAELLKQVRGGSIHFCCNGQHLIESMLDIPDLRGLDFGQAELMDIPHIYRLARAKQVAITCHKPIREDLLSGKAKAEFPTGVVFVYNTDTLEDAIILTKEYYGI